MLLQITLFVPITVALIFVMIKIVPPKTALA
uniref:Uncharacterized protein n=1 Tax=Arundo donax TaxID=35708 RepID=A0A0A9HTR3_ARUDO